MLQMAQISKLALIYRMALAELLCFPQAGWLDSMTPLVTEHFKGDFYFVKVLIEWILKNNLLQTWVFD